MDNFGVPTEINVSVMNAIVELQNTTPDGLVYEKKICDHVVYDKSDKDSLVMQSLYNLTFLEVLVRCGSSFALRQNLRFPSGASAIPWIVPRNQNKNLKRAAEMEAKSAAKKKKYAAKIDSYFTKYFEIYKNKKANEVPENPEINTGPEVLPPNALLEEQVLGNVKSKVKYTNHKKKRNFEDKKKNAKIDLLFAFYFEKYKNFKTINNPENSEERTLGSTGLDDDNIILQLSAPLNDQTSKPMENVVENVELKRKITMAKEIEDNPNVYVSKRESILGSLGLKKANNIMSINALKDQEYFSRWQFTDPLVI